MKGQANGWNMIVIRIVAPRPQADPNVLELMSDDPRYQRGEHVVLLLSNISYLLVDTEARLTDRSARADDYDVMMQLLTPVKYLIKGSEIIKLNNDQEIEWLSYDKTLEQLITMTHAVDEELKSGRGLKPDIKIR